MARESWRIMASADSVPETSSIMKASTDLPFRRYSRAKLVHHAADGSLGRGRVAVML